jgi:SH3-like domain-containing protein
MPRALFVCIAMAVLVSVAAPAGAAPIKATIRGAESVNVRRGPGPDTPAFVALHRGDTVRVEERTGQWVRVALESGERGYVNAAFIDLAPGATIPEAAPTEIAAETPSGEASPEPTATVAAAPPAIDRELAALRERLASLEANMQHGGAGPHAHAEGAEGGVEPPAPMPAMVEPPATLEVGPSLALAGVGLVIGFLIGTFYGSRQERNRRTRVRF